MLPVASLVTFGKMLKRYRDAWVIFGVIFVLSLATLAWVVSTDTLAPNPALTAHAEQNYEIADPTAPSGHRTLNVPAVVGLPVDQSLGNLEGKELRFGTAAGATWAAVTTNTSNGSVNCMHDSLNPIAGITPLVGMWLNCIWGGVGVGLINLLVYLVVGVFLAGLMVGRTPEYLGKKVEAREMKLASLALLIHPLMILAPTGLFAAMGWSTTAQNNPGAHGFAETMYEFSSASANNGSGFEGLGDTWGFNKAEDNPSPPAPCSPHMDIACGLVMLISRLRPHHRAVGAGGQPGPEEADALHGGHVAHRHGHVCVRPFGHDTSGWRTFVPAGGRPWAGGRTPWTFAFWRLIHSCQQQPLNRKPAHRRKNSNSAAGTAASWACSIRRP